MMQLRTGLVGRLTLEELREACDWAIRFATYIGPDEPTAFRVMLRLADALTDAYEQAVREHYGLPPRDFFADGTGDAS